MSKPVLNTSRKLLFPVTIEDEKRTIDEVNLRRPKVGDYRAADKEGGSNADAEIRLLSRLSGIPMSVFDDMDMQDYKQIQNDLKSFTEAPTKK